jgi:hypothetical protein
VNLDDLTPMIACPPDAEPLEFALRTVEGLVDDDGWDGPNRVFFLEVAPNPLGAVPGTGAIAAREAPFGPHMDRLHPAQLLDLAAAAAMLIGLPKPAFAVVAVFEAWSVAKDPSAGPAEQAKLVADRAGRQLHTRADRVEVRMAHLVTVDGREIMLRRRRGDEPMVPEAGAEQYSGSVPDALRRLAQVVRTHARAAPG